jgi:hypothetical protein
MSHWLSGPAGSSKAIQNSVRLTPNHNRSATNCSGWIIPDLLAMRPISFISRSFAKCIDFGLQVRGSHRPVLKLLRDRQIGGVRNRRGHLPYPAVGRDADKARG